MVRMVEFSNRQEEKFLFPECEKLVPGSMGINVEQHQSFHDDIEAMESYFEQVKKNPSLYNGERVISLLDKFGPVFCKHLEEEIGTLERSKLVAIFPNEQEFKKIWVDMMDWIISTSSKLTSLPWVNLRNEVWIDRRLYLTIKKLVHLGS